MPIGCQPIAPEPDSRKCVDESEADNDGLDQIEDSKKLMVAFVLRDRCDRLADEINRTADEVLRP